MIVIICTAIEQRANARTRSSRPAADLLAANKNMELEQHFIKKLQRRFSRLIRRKFKACRDCFQFKHRACQ